MDLKLIVSGVVFLILFRLQADSVLDNVFAYDDPAIPVVDAAVYADRLKPNLPDSIPVNPTQPVPPKEEERRAELPKQAPFSQQEKQEQDQLERLVVVYGEPWCGLCLRMKNELRNAGVAAEDKNSSIQYKPLSDLPANVRSSVSLIPTTFVYVDGKEVERVTGYLSVTQLRQRADRLTPTELKKRISSYTGGIAYVSPSSYNNYMAHISDKNQHGGRYYERWQLSGLTLQELQKLHGAQHAGIYYSR